MKIGASDFPIGKRTYVMGILNITPDSFSDGGKYNSIEAALHHTQQMIEEGVDIIDIGGESTRPGHNQITIQEEMQRIVPVIHAIKKTFPTMPISIDTYKSQVCEAAIEAGADFVNDIWGFKYDTKMADLTAKYHLPCCLMHNKATTVYTNFMDDFLEELGQCIEIALAHGVSSDNIILDPGIGFGKTYEQNLILMDNLEKIKERYPQYPVLLGTSRKSMIGKALGNVPPQQRCSGTVATTVVGIMKHCDFVRVHDIKENKEACLMTDAIVRNSVNFAEAY